MISPSQYSNRTGDLTEYILLFCQELRREGLLVGIQEEIDSLKALEAIDIIDQKQCKLALQTVLCSGKDDLPIFENMFSQFFKENPSQEMQKRKTKEMPSDPNAESNQRKSDSSDDQTVKSQPKQGKNMDQYSSSVTYGAEHSNNEDSLLQAIQFMAAKAGRNSQKTREAVIPDIHQDVMEQAAYRFLKVLKLRQSRRTAANHGLFFDGRKTIRRSMHTGGSPIELMFKGKKPERAKIVLLGDGSRSMSPYTPRFLQFAYCLTAKHRYTETFLFSTTLSHVTSQLKTEKQDPPALQMYEDSWGSGTCIGESLNEFVIRYGSQYLTKNTVVLVMSDGLDTSEAGYMKKALQEIKRKSSLLIWLNPLLGTPGYRPEKTKMREALPFIDIFSEAHQLDSYLRLSKETKRQR